MQLNLFKPADILTDELQRVVQKVRNDLKPTAQIIHLPYKKRQLFSCSNVGKQQHGNNKHS
jgi:hypothetical protein